MERGRNASAGELQCSSKEANDYDMGPHTVWHTHRSRVEDQQM